MEMFKKNMITHQWGSNMYDLDGGNDYARSNGNSYWTKGCDGEKKEVSTAMSAVVAVETNLW